MMKPVLVHLLLQGILLYDSLAWRVTMPKGIRGLRGSCLVIPCSFDYTLYPPTNPRRVVWYQWVSRGYPLVYDPWYPNDVIGKFRGKTDLYGNPSYWDCSLLITKLELSHHGEKLYAWIDPENVGKSTYAFYDVASTISVDVSPQKPNINIYGGEKMGDSITVACSTPHTCPYRKPNIILNGIEGTDQLDNNCNNAGQCKLTLTRKGVVKAESSTIKCFVTHYGVHQKIKIEPELADVTEGVAKNFICSVYHSCQRETPTITWNYENMQVSTERKTLSGLDRVTFSKITFLGAKDDNGKKLICTAKFSGGNIEASVVLRVQRIVQYNALGWEVMMPKDIRGLRGSCLVIPCSFSYTLNPPKNPRRVVWYQWTSKGSPLVYDPLHSNNVIEKFRGKTDLFGDSSGDCSLLIKNLEQSHHGETLYTRIDPENVPWHNYKFHDVTSKIIVDASPQQPSINIYGGDRTGDSITIVCSTFHTCPFSKPNIILNGIKGTDKIDNEHIKDGLWKITLTRTGVVQAERLTIECSVTHHGGTTVTANEVKNAHCVHQKIRIEPELADVTDGVAKNFTCSVYHSCQRETPTITWNYENMQVSTERKTLSGLDRVTFSKITFLGAKDDNGKKLICTAKFSGGNIEASVVLHVQRIVQYDALGWAVMMPKDIRGLRGSCLVIPCSFSYTSNPPKNPRRVVWYQWTSKGYPLVYEPLHANNVIEKFRGKTDLFGDSSGDCSLLIKNLEQSHHGETLYTRIDPENVPWHNYKFHDVTSKIIVDASPQQPSINIYGGDRTGDSITIVCSAFHTCPFSKPNIILNGIKGTDKTDNEHIKDGLWKITLTRTGVVQAERLTIECSVTHHGGTTVTANEVKNAQCVHQKIRIEPELADVTDGVAKNFTCSVYHSCQRETPTITWNYENMQVSTERKTLSGLDQVTFSNITFLGAEDDNGKKLICSAIFSGGNTEIFVVLRVQQYQKPVDPILNETHFQYEADVIPRITALPRSCVVIPCSFKVEEDYVTRLRVLWVTKKGGYMFHTDSHEVLDNFRGRTRLLGNPDEQNCTVEMDNVQTHDNGPFCFRAEREKEKYSFNNSCVFIIMRASPDKPVMSSLPEDIEPGTRITVKCSVNHTCSSHPPKISWSVPTARETISHNHMGGGIWETVSAVTFIPTGYEEKDEIVCSAKFWGGKTQNNTAFLSVKKIEVQAITSETFGLYAIAPSLVFILICVLAGVCIYKRRHRQPCQDMQGSQTQSAHRCTGNAPERQPKPEQRRSIWRRFPRHQSPRNIANLRAEYKANNTCTVSGNK